MEKKKRTPKKANAANVAAKPANTIEEVVVDGETFKLEVADLPEFNVYIPGLDENADAVVPEEKEDEITSVGLPTISGFTPIRESDLEKLEASESTEDPVEKPVDPFKPIGDITSEKVVLVGSGSTKGDTVDIIGDGNDRLFPKVDHISGDSNEGTVNNGGSAVGSGTGQPPVMKEEKPSAVKKFFKGIFGTFCCGINDGWYN